MGNRKLMKRPKPFSKEVYSHLVSTHTEALPPRTHSANVCRYLADPQLTEKTIVCKCELDSAPMTQNC